MDSRDEIEDAAVWLRSRWLGTDYPDVAWEDAPESEKAAWLRLAMLRGKVSGAAEVDDMNALTTSAV